MDSIPRDLGYITCCCPAQTPTSQHKNAVMVPAASGVDLNLVAMVTGIKISSGAELRRNLNSQVPRYKTEEKS